MGSAQLAIGLAALMAAMMPECAQAAPLSAASRVSPRGVGPIVIGSTPAQAAATGTVLRASTPSPGSSCFYLRPTAPAGLAFLVEAGTLRRAEIVNSAIATTDGFRVGDPLAKLQAAYGTRAHLSPGKYDPASQTLTIDPKSPADAAFRLMFVLRGGIVRTIFAGALPQVAYVEGCS
jgi:hypothetical protein